MSETPYRTNAEIAEEIPPMKKPWPKSRKVLVWLATCILTTDAAIAIAAWGSFTHKEVGAAIAMHAAVIFFAGLVCIVEDVKI